MIKRNIIINKHRTYDSSYLWGSIIGVNDDGTLEYYTGQTASNAYLCKIPILFTSTNKNIGLFTPYVAEWSLNTDYSIGEIIKYNDITYKCIETHNSGILFDEDKWDYRNDNSTTDSYVTFSGQTKISEFRRYSKNDDDIDLYNPTGNTGFTHVIYGSNGLTYKITGERDNNSDGGFPKLYDYKIYPNNSESDAVVYSDTNSQESIITYKTSGLNATNSGYDPLLKLEYLIGVLDDVKTSVDVFIERGFNSSFDKHIRLSEVKSVVDMFNYGNGYFKIKED